jgi:hypothetical protein
MPAVAKVEVACDGFDAAEKMLSLRPHLVFLALNMPGLDSLAVCRKIKRNPANHHTRVVLMARDGMPVDRQQTLAAGAEACLLKPVDERQLLDIVNGQGRGRCA